MELSVRAELVAGIVITLDEERLIPSVITCLLYFISHKKAN